MLPKTDLLKLREEWAAVLDVKLADMLEWRTFRTFDRALMGGDAVPNPAPLSNAAQYGIRKITLVPPIRRTATYTTLADQALDYFKRPITTPELMEFIGKHRVIDEDPEKAKINVASAMSREKRFKSISWGAGRAWWFADQPVPDAHAATEPGWLIDLEDK